MIVDAWAPTARRELLTHGQGGAIIILQMSSSVTYRLHAGKDHAQVHFDGNGIRLLDLKREVLERKFAGSQSTDFDFKVKVEEGERGN